MEAEFTSLLGMSQEIAKEKQASLPAVIKELLHYEIIQALLQSGSASELVFQGGTALRLCYGGVRYSEDLDFAGGLDFDPSSMKPFVEKLKDNVGATYGLSVAVDEHLPNRHDNVPVGRWKSKILLPDYDKSAKQNYVIHVEVAQIPAYSSEVRPLQVISNRVAYGYRSLMLKVESKDEILADKIVALGARDYLKSRDLWDIHMLAQDGVWLNTDFVRSKIKDYHLDFDNFLHRLRERVAVLGQPSTISAFQKEMSRFLDSSLQAFIQDTKVVRNTLDVVVDVAETALSQLALAHPSSTEKPRSRLRR